MPSFLKEFRIFPKISGFTPCDAIIKYCCANVITLFFDRMDGVRIEHFLLNALAADLLLSGGVDKYMRSRDRPSDHVPVWIELLNTGPNV